jgi:hypothetical protein
MPELANGHDPLLFEVAREALLEITTDESIGDPAGVIDVSEGVVSVQFESALSGYPGWRWTVSLSTLDDGAPSVLETELIPAEGALLAPDWVPWSDRLADYKAAQEATASETSEDSEDVDVAESDDDDDDDLGSDVLHGGDLDGVDIDLAESEEDEDEDDDPDEDDDSDDDDSDDEDDDLDDDGDSDDDDLDEGLREV